MKHPIIWLFPFLVTVFLLSSCQSKYERFQTEAAEAQKLVIYFYEDTATMKIYKGLKITAGQSERIKMIVGFVGEPVSTSSPCSPVGHILLTGKNGQQIFDLPFCLTGQSAYVKFSENEFRKVNDQGTQFFRKNYKTFQSVRH